MVMELRHLRYFVAVASHGSFTRAAEILHLTQPPLSRQVRDLEEELGVALLVRGSNSVTLTEEGERFYEEAREVLARAEEAVRRTRGHNGREILRVGYSSSMASHIISLVLAKLQVAAPQLRVELADLSSRETYDMAREGRLDFLVYPRMCLAKGIIGFNWTELCHLQPVLVLSARHPLAKLKRIPLARLRNLPLVGLANENYPEYVPCVRDLLKPFGISPHFVSLVNDNFATLLVELEAQCAAAIMLETIAGVLPQTLVLRPFAVKLPGFSVVIGLPALRPKRHAEMFAQMLAEEVQRQ